MGKAARRMKKKQEQIVAEEIRQENSALEEKLAAQMAAEEYAAAIETLADLIKGDDMKPQFMYDAAYAYFMLNDYDRAGEWINNTLTYAPEHIPVRILLARLLILQGREEDGLGVFDFLLRDGAAALTEEQKDEVEEIVEFYGRIMKGKIRQDYPNIAAFLMLDEEEDGKNDEGILDSLRRKVAQASAAVEERAAEAVGEMSERAAEAAAVASERAAEAAAAASERAAEAMAAVKPMVEAQAAAVQDAVTAAMPKVEAGAAAMAKKPAELLAKLKQRIAAANDAAAGAGAAGDTAPPPVPQEAFAPNPQCLEAAALVKENVLAKGLPTADKVELLTSFAGSYYYQGDLRAAELLLAAALELLPPSDEILTNMALVQAELGKREEAFQTASKMKLTNFLLLRLLRG